MVVFGTGVAYGEVADRPNLQAAFAEIAPAQGVSGDLNQNEPACGANLQNADAPVRNRSAQVCADMMDDPRIAMVDFGTSLSGTANIGAQITDRLNIVTGGRVKAKLTVLPATDVAKKSLDTALEGKGCIDSDVPKQHASTAVDATMDLSQYDLVIGVSGKKECKGDALSQMDGVANGDGRTMDLFEVKTPPELALSAEDFTISSAVHEILHQFGELHAGEVIADSGQLSEYLRTAKGRTVVMEHYLQGASFHEYDNSKVMGSSMARPTTPLDGPQLDCLDTAKRILGRADMQLENPIGTAPLIFNASQAANGQFGSLKLDAPVCFETATVGSVSAEAGRQPWKLKVGGQSITIQHNRGTVTVVMQ